MWKKMVLAKPVYTISHTTQAWLCGLHQYAPSDGAELETLKMATSNAAQIVEMAGEMNPYQAHKLGVIMPDITRVRPEHIKLAIKGGTIYKNALQEAGRLVSSIR